MRLELEKKRLQIFCGMPDGMTAHYSVAQINELVEALNRITNEGSRINRSLAMIRREQLGEKSHPKVTINRKMG